jgi:hypothetical protein
MKRKIIITALISTLLISSSANAQFDFLYNNKGKIAIGIAAIGLMSTLPKDPVEMQRLADGLSKNLKKVPDYFSEYPNMYYEVSKYILNKLNTTSNQQEFNRLRNLGKEMQMDAILHPGEKIKYDSKYWNEKINYFKDNPEQLKGFIKNNLAAIRPINTFLLDNMIRTFDRKTYEQYKQLAEQLGIKDIPKFAGAPYELPNNLVNVPQPQNPKANQLTNPINDKPLPNKLENPAIDKPFSNIIENPQGKPFDTSIEFPLEQPKTWKDYLLLKQDSTELRDKIVEAEKLKDPNYVKPDNVAAHHLVSSTSPDTKDARDILEKYLRPVTPSGEQTYNNEINGVLLPNLNNTDPNIPGIQHNGRHPSDYNQTVNQMIKDADNSGGWSKVQKTLEDIKQELLNAPRNSKWKDLF